MEIRSGHRSGSIRAKYISSFIGLAPADDPAITIAVVMDEPKFGGRDGGWIGCTGFSRDRTARYLPELKIARDLESTATVAESEDIPETPGIENPTARRPKSDDGAGEHPKAAMPNARTDPKEAEKLLTPNPKDKSHEMEPKRSPEKPTEPENRSD